MHFAREIDGGVVAYLASRMENMLEIAGSKEMYCFP